jgi:hypothetical protein
VWVYFAAADGEHLSYIVDPTDGSGLVDHVRISAASIRFLIDNARTADTGWACDAL